PGTLPPDRRERRGADVHGNGVLAPAAAHGARARARPAREGAAVSLVHRHGAVLDLEPHHGADGHAPAHLRRELRRQRRGARVARPHRSLGGGRAVPLYERRVLHAGDARHRAGGKAAPAGPDPVGRAARAREPASGAARSLRTVDCGRRGARAHRVRGAAVAAPAHADLRLARLLAGLTLPMRFLKTYPLPVIVGAGLVIGLAARFLFAAPQVGQWVFLAALLAGGGP